MKAASDRPAGVTTNSASSFPAVIDLSTLDGSDGFRIDGLVSLDQTGYSVGAGDFNGDGYGDIIIGGQGADPQGRQEAGSSYVIFGQAGAFTPTLSLSGLNGHTGFRLDGVAAHGFSGYSVSSAGDINHDGYDDMIVGAYGINSYAGDAYVVFGKAGAFLPGFKLAGLNGTNGFHFTGMGAYAEIGLSVASAGDFNHDGFDDLALSANGSQSAYIVFGKASGYAATFDLTTLDGANGVQLVGLYGESNSIKTVTLAGDVNGDGIDDLIVGAASAGPGGRTYAGSAYVLFGKAGGFAATLDVNALTPADGFRIDGVAAGDRGGYTVAAGGDINGDGYGDLLISAFLADNNGHADSGSAYVVFGKASGFPAAFNLANLHGNNGFRVDGFIDSNYVGYSLSAAGDFNGDGFGDLIVSSLNNDSAYLLFGKASGFSATLDLSTLDGTDGVRLALPAGAYSVSAAGDVNGDGLADIALGSLLGDPSAPVFAGSTYVLFGRLPDGAVTRVGSAAGQTIWGGAFDDTLSGRDGDDVLIGGGGRDLLNGGTGADTFVFKALGDSTNAAPDRIADLTDADVIDLSAIDANTNATGNQAFHLAAAFTHHAREAVLSYDAAHNRTVLQLDVNADAVADMTVWITGDHHGFVNFVL